MNVRRGILAEDHRSRTCPGPLAAPTGFEVQPPHRRRRSSAPRLLHGGGAHYSYFLALSHPPITLFFRFVSPCHDPLHRNSRQIHKLRFGTTALPEKKKRKLITKNSNIRILKDGLRRAMSGNEHGNWILYCLLFIEKFRVRLCRTR